MELEMELSIKCLSFCRNFGWTLIELEMELSIKCLSVLQEL